jgi:hypothetical protein
LETPAHIGIAPELGADNDTVLAEIATPRAQIEDFGNERSSDAVERVPSGAARRCLLHWTP